MDFLTLMPIMITSACHLMGYFLRSDRDRPCQVEALFNQACRLTFIHPLLKDFPFNFLDWLYKSQTYPQHPFFSNTLHTKSTIKHSHPPVGVNLQHLKAGSDKTFANIPVQQGKLGIK